MGMKSRKPRPQSSRQPGIITQTILANSNSYPGEIREILSQNGVEPLPSERSISTIRNKLKGKHGLPDLPFRVSSKFSSRIRTKPAKIKGALLKNPDAVSKEILELAKIKDTLGNRNLVSICRVELRKFGHAIKIRPRSKQSLTETQRKWIREHQNTIRRFALDIAKKRRLPKDYYADWVNTALLKSAQWSTRFDEKKAMFSTYFYGNLKLYFRVFLREQTVQLTGILPRYVDAIYSARKIVREKGISFEDAARQVIEKRTYALRKGTTPEELVEMDQLIKSVLSSLSYERDFDEGISSGGKGRRSFDD
ncbi:hypothetical protein IIC68_01510 [archaeon]|nr:hypothetical protein [archaeon]